MIVLENNGQCLGLSHGDAIVVTTEDARGRIISGRMPVWESTPVIALMAFVDKNRTEKSEPYGLGIFDGQSQKVTATLAYEGLKIYSL